MIAIGGNDDVAVGNARTDELHIKVFHFGNYFHLWGNNTFSGHFQLCHKTPPKTIKPGLRFFPGLFQPHPYARITEVRF
jgi:hypothetical protein